MLKPCPFCGGNKSMYAEESHPVGKTTAFMYCPECTAKGPENIKLNMQEAIDAWNRRAGGWVKCSPESMPENEKPVLALVNDEGRRTIVRAAYVRKGAVEDMGDFEGDTDYDEEKDAYFWPEGWYEWNYYEETHWGISDVTHWMPLPERPSDDE